MRKYNTNIIIAHLQDAIGVADCDPSGEMLLYSAD